MPTPATSPIKFQTLKPFAVLRPGDFVATDGSKWSYRAEDMHEIAAAYSAAFSAHATRAPIVVGHPSLNAPAYGWVGGVRVDADGTLLVERAEVTPEFATAAIAEKRYNKVSIALWPRDHASNPTPGRLNIRHIGVLGGAAPAIPNLGSVEYASGAALVIEFAAPDGAPQFGYEDKVAARLLRGLRDWLIAQFGQEAADKALPADDLDYLQESVAAESAFAAGGGQSPHPAGVPHGDAGSPPPRDLDARTPAFSTPAAPVSPPPTHQGVSMTEAELAAREAALTQREAALAAQEAATAQAAQRAEFAAFTAGLEKEGRLLPVQSPQAIAVLLALAPKKDASPEFAAGDANHGKTPLELAKGLLSSLPPQVQFGELEKPKAGASPSFAAPDGMAVDAAQLDVHNRAIAYQREHAGVDYMSAVAAVSA